MAEAACTAGTRIVFMVMHVTFVSGSIWINKGALTVLFIFNIFSGVPGTVLKFVDPLKHTDDTVPISPESTHIKTIFNRENQFPKSPVLTWPFLFPNS